MELTGWVFDLRRYSVHDGPGIRTTVFLKGCPLRCAWCQNPESQASMPELLYRAYRCIACGACVEACPNGALELRDGRIAIDAEACDQFGACVLACPAEARELVGRRMGVAEVLREIEKDRLFFEESGGGATFSGGEPLHQPDFLRELLLGCRALGIRSALDTCGYAPPDVALELARLSDLVLYDLKHMDDRAHLDGTGVSNAVILSNLRLLAEAGVELLVRVPLVPGFNDGDANLRRTAEFVASLARVPRVEVLPFHAAAQEKHRRFGMPYRQRDNRTQSEAELGACRAWFARAGVPVESGG